MFTGYTATRSRPGVAALHTELPFNAWHQTLRRYFTPTGRRLSGTMRRGARAMRFSPTRRATPRTISTFVALAASAVLAGCGTSTTPTPGTTVGVAPSTRPTPGAPASAELASDYGSPVVVGLIETDDVRESSGLSASECQDVLWTHNDSGNDALIYAMSTEGKHLGTWRVGGAQNVDWESIATYKDPTGKCFLILGDIGDNDEARGELLIYRIPEPTASAETATSNSVSPLQTEPAQSMKFSYPNGSNNAETLLVHPWTGDIYIVTKKEIGPAGVFRMKPAFGTDTAVMSEKVADVSVPSEPEGLLTGGSISPDGRRVMLCDLKGGYELVLPEGAVDPDAIWGQNALAVDLGDRKQGEGVSYGRDGLSLFASSEKKNSPLFLIERK
jgi:hypothetical protein